MEASLDASRAQWFIETTSILLSSASIILVAVTLLFMSAELWWSQWSRFRSLVLILLGTGLTSFVLVTTTMTSIAALLAKPVLLERAKKDQR